MLAKAGFVAVRDEEEPILDFKDYNQNLKGDIRPHVLRAEGADKACTHLMAYLAAFQHDVASRLPAMLAQAHPDAPAPA